LSNIFAFNEKIWRLYLNVAKAGGLQSQEEPLPKILLDASSRKAGALRVKL
jgi:hypothetical protein